MSTYPIRKTFIKAVQKPIHKVSIPPGVIYNAALKEPDEKGNKKKNRGNEKKKK